MRTEFSAELLEDPDMQAMEGILRKCVHCGFCNSTCPTFQLTGDELDGPRGRIYLMKSMFEEQATPSEKVVERLDRCLSCLSCMTTCPSGVDYMHLIDQGREYIEEKHDRKWTDRLQRLSLARILTNAKYFQVLMKVAQLFSPLHRLLPRVIARPLRLAAQTTKKSSVEFEPFYPAATQYRGSVALLTGCVQQVMDTEINQASIRLLNKQGFDVHVLGQSTCCGAIEHHLGEKQLTQQRVNANIENWVPVLETVDAIITNASGCGTMLKDYAYLMREKNSPIANKITAASKDICEFLHGQDIISDSFSRKKLSIAYQSPCSMQHGQKIEQEPVALLREFGYRVTTINDAHLCCGSAGTYNILQAEFAEKLGRQKADNIQLTNADVVASGNLGCMLQLRQYSSLPFVHTVQLLDWASGGPEPDAIHKLKQAN